MSNVRTITLFYVLLLQVALVASTAAQEADSLGAGGVAIHFADLDSFLVVVDHDFSRYTVVTPEDSILVLPAGRRHLTLASKGAFDSIVNIDVVADSLTHVIVSQYPIRGRPSYPMHLHSSYPRLIWGATLAIHTDSDATIYLDGTRLGTGRALLDLPKGDYDIMVEHPLLGRRSERVYVVDNRMITADIYLRPDSGKMRSAALLPGGGHFYRGQTVRGSLAFTAVTGALAGAVYSHLQTLPLRKDFEAVQRQYQISLTERDAKVYGDRGDELAASINSFHSRRNLLIGVAVSAYALQMIDGMRRPRSGFREPIDHQYLIVPSLSAEGAQLNFRYRF